MINFMYANPFLKNLLWKNAKLLNSSRVLLNLTVLQSSSDWQFHKKNYSSLCQISKFYNSNQPFLQIMFRKQNIQVYVPSKSIWGWLNSIFNRVDESRILDAGPDRACAEWLLRCGAGVKWVNSENWIKDYNSLPLGKHKLYKIEEVDGTNSAVMHIGFPHFKNCKHIHRVVFHKSAYLDDEALAHLHYIKNSLKYLQISSCGNVTREGLNHIKGLINLEHLLLYDLPCIQDKDKVVKDLQAYLPNCAISFPYAQASERSSNEEAT